MAHLQPSAQAVFHTVDALKNIIIKSALTTLGIVAGCAVVVFAILSLGFPGTLCGWCEQLGNYGFAVKYASLYYSYTDDIADLARCADDSILAENDGYIIEYCTGLVDRKEFTQYCAERDSEIAESQPWISFSYRQYIYGAVSSAHYSGGDIQTALGFAIQSLDADFDRSSFASGGDYSITEFPLNNALGSLSLRIAENSDASAAKTVLPVLSSVSCTQESELLYLNTLISALSKL